MATIRKFPLLKRFVLLLIVAGFVIAAKLLEKGKEESETKTNFSPKVISRKSTNSGNDEKEFLKIFHLDLKGGPPKLDYLVEILPLIQKSGANAILIEYEDMFPFWGSLRNVSARNAYSLEEVNNFVDLATVLKMELIPLIQTFGHLEYVLKLEEFQQLRELESFPQELCPSKKNSMDLVKEMIRQIMKIHVTSRYIHIGCDEIRHLGACPRCSRMDTKKVFSRHVKRTGSFVRSHFPGVTPLIWDDMLRGWTLEDLQGSGLASLVQPVVWVYGNNIFVLVPRFTWNSYIRVFPAVWVASAFKGAFGETEILPDLKRHLENTISWTSIIQEEKEHVAGIFVTGWSRYDHFAALCELLPAGLPSLLLNLIFLDSERQGYGASTKVQPEEFFKWLSVLGCPKAFLEASLNTLEKENLFRYQLGRCSFPGSDLYAGISAVVELKKRVEKIDLKIKSSGWMSRYNLKKKFTSPWRITEMFPEEGFAGEFLLKDILAWKTSFFPVMKKYLDDYTIEEWEEQNVKPLEEKMKEIQKVFRTLIGKKTWPRRPLA